MDGLTVEDLEQIEGAQGEKVEITTLVNSFLDKQDLGLLPPKAMHLAVDSFVEKKDAQSISKYASSSFLFCLF